MSIQIFVMTHKPFTPPPDPLYVPFQVGRAVSEPLGFLSDRNGDTISELNPYFCELTGMYWLWKNYHTAEPIGVCHYRRYLLNESGAPLTEAQLRALLARHEVVTTKLLTLPGPYYDGFCADHHQKDLDTTRAVLIEKYPSYADMFDTLVQGNRTYFGNILITSKPQYDAYCAWLFDILLEVYRRTDMTGYTGYQKRLFGFLAEFLQTVWIRQNHLSVHECLVGMLHEKYETRQLKEQLAALLEKRDYDAAERRFWDCYRKRPDVLMEASDPFGELRLCMQIIATSRLEDETYGRCILDKLPDYPAAVRCFRAFNAVISRFAEGKETGDDLLFLSRNALITPAAISVAVRLFAPPASVSALCGRLTPLLSHP